MTATLILLSAALITWGLRIVFVALVPAGRLPGRVHDALDDVAPAVMGAIVVTHLAHGEGLAGIAVTDLGAVAVSAVVALRTRNLAATVMSGVLAAGLLRLL
jgi:branched-subunit amino acid transport protein